MRKLVLYIILILCIVSCRTQASYTLTDTVYVETIHRDTVISFAADSASMKALLQCDSMGNVLLKQIDFLQGNNITLQTRLLHNSPITTLNSPITTLTVDCKQDSLQKEIELLTTKIKQNRTEVRTIEVPKKMNAWQAFIHVSGYLAWSCLILGFILKIILKAKGIYGL